MSTNADIILENYDGTVITIYNHHDGYPEHLGQVLKTFYTTQESVEALVRMGDASFIDSDLECSTFYHRDRGEDLNLTHLRSIDEIKHPLEYQYLFRNGKWLMNSYSDRTWKELS